MYPTAKIRNIADICTRKIATRILTFFDNVDGLPDVSGMVLTMSTKHRIFASEIGMCY
jgi:hypothetical protein